MHELTSSISAMVAWLAVGLPLLGGFLAVGALRRPPWSLRTDRGGATAAALALAITVGAVATGLIGALSGMFGGGPNYALGLAWGAGIAALTFLSSLAGYALLARRSAGLRAILGIVLGPLLFIGGPIGASAAFGAAGNLLATGQAIGDRAARSDGLQLVASDVATTLRSDGTVARVDLVATVNASRAYEVNIDPAVGGPHFLLYPAGQISGGGLLYAVPPSGPVSYAAGSSTRHELRLVADSYTHLAPGSWRLQMTFIDFNGLEYQVEIPVDLRAG